MMQHGVPKNRYTFVDLFAGAGGFTEGLLLSDDTDGEFRLVGASDINDCARLTHEGRFIDQFGFNYPFLVKDIRDEDFIETFISNIVKIAGATSVDVVCGGPPCQGFSIYGLRNENDPRNALFKSYVDVVANLSPKYFVMENVPGLATMYRGAMPKLIEAYVDEATRGRYKVYGPFTVNSANYGVPQMRERIVFIGKRIDMEEVEISPKGVSTALVTVGQAISDLSFLRAWESTNTYNHDYSPVSEYQRESRQGRLFRKYGMVADQSKLFNHEAAKHTPEVIARFAMIEKGTSYESIPTRLWDAHLQTEKKWCVRLDDNRVSYTVTTLPDDLIHYRHHRILTVREWARLQSFDDTFVFKGPRSTGGGGAGNRKRLVELPQYTQVGNAVPPLLGKGIGEAVLGALERSRQRHARKVAQVV